VRYDYKAHFFEVDSYFISLFHLLEKGVTMNQLEQFIREHTEPERGKLLATIRDLETQKFLVEKGDYAV
jgi:hypothetical protein